MSAALNFRRAALPAIVSGALLIASWWLPRMSWSAIDLIQGSFLLAALVVTFTAISAGGAITKWSTVCISFAFQILAAAIFLAMIAVDSRAFGVPAFFKVSAVVTAWIALCTALPFLLRQCRLGVGLSIIPPAILAAAVLAFPATVVPAHRALGGSMRADRFASAAVYACPIYGMFNATSGEMPSPWPSGRNRIMYDLTIFDQNAANPVARWRFQALIFAGLAILFAGTAYFIHWRQLSARQSEP